MKTPKPIKRLTRSWLLALATRIYDPKTRRFMRLCRGTLQNGPDRFTGQPMHCGLGELYFAMTGKQPQQGLVDEDEVVALAVELAGFDGGGLACQRAADAVEALGVPQAAKDAATKALWDNLTAFATDERSFTEALEGIPLENDHCSGTCQREDFRSRAARVARLLRAAAGFLPQ